MSLTIQADTIELCRTRPLEAAEKLTRVWKDMQELLLHLESLEEHYPNLKQSELGMHVSNFVYNFRHMYPKPD